MNFLFFESLSCFNLTSRNRWYWCYSFSFILFCLFFLEMLVPPLKPLADDPRPPVAGWHSGGHTKADNSIFYPQPLLISTPSNDLLPTPANPLISATSRLGSPSQRFWTIAKVSKCMLVNFKSYEWLMYQPCLFPAFDTQSTLIRTIYKGIKPLRNHFLVGKQCVMTKVWESSVVFEEREEGHLMTPKGLSVRVQPQCHYMAKTFQVCWACPGSQRCPAENAPVVEKMYLVTSTVSWRRIGGWKTMVEIYKCVCNNGQERCGKQMEVVLTTRTPPSKSTSVEPSSLKNLHHLSSSVEPSSLLNSPH